MAIHTQNKSDSARDPHGWRQEGKDLMRAIAGGCLFGMPLLYTMEVWHHGMTFSSGQLLMLLGIALVMNFIGGLVSGVRKDCSVLSAILDAATAVGMALVLSALILALIGVLDFKQKLLASLGAIILTSTVVSIGISFMSQQFRSDKKSEEDEREEKEWQGKPLEERRKMQIYDDLRDLGGSILGAIVFSFSVAPTEEILLIATNLGPLQTLLLFICEALLCYIILFASGLWKRSVYTPDSLFQSAFAETAMSFSIALVVSAALLATLGYEGTTSSVSNYLGCVVALALPASVGAAAGKIVV